MVRRDRIAGAVLLLFMIGVPGALFVAWLRAPEAQREGALVFLMLSGVLPASLWFVVRQLLVRAGRGLVFRAVRGGANAVIEVRPRAGGRGVLLPLGDALSTQHVYRIGLRRIVVAEASVATSCGEIVFARGGTRLDSELLAWLDAVGKSSGTDAPDAGSIELDTVAASAGRQPLAPPPGIEASSRDGWPTWRYRTAPAQERNLLIPWMALLALWLFAAHATGVLPSAPLATFVIPVELVLAWVWLWTAPGILEVQCRGPMLLLKRRRFGWTIGASVLEATDAGLDLVTLPAVALKFGRRRRGVTSPVAGGPDVVAMAWLSAAIRSCAATVERSHASR